MKRTMICIFSIILLIFISSIQAQTLQFEPITADNAAQLIPVGSLGFGRIMDGYYEDLNHMSLIAPGSLWHYDLTETNLVPQWEQLGDFGFYPIVKSPDHRWFLGNDGRLWDAEQHRMAHEFRAENRVLTADFSPDSSLLAVTYEIKCEQQPSDCSETILWDVIQGEARFVWQTNVIRRVRFTHAGQYLAIADAENTVFHDVNTGDDAFHLPANLYHWSADRTVAVSTTVVDKTISLTVWDVLSRTPRMLLTFQQREVLTEIALNDDGSRLMLASYIHGQFVGTFTIWDTQHGKRTAYYNGMKGAFDVMRLSPNGRFLVANSLPLLPTRGQPIYIYDLWTQQEQVIEPIDVSRDLAWVEFRSDNQRLLITYLDGSLRELDLMSGQVKTLSLGLPGYSENADFGDDTILTTTSDGLTLTWDAATLELRNREPDCYLIAYYAATGLRLCRPADLQPYRLSNATILTPPATNTYSFLQAVFSPDGKQIAAQTEAGILVWDTATGALLHDFASRNANFGRSLAFIREGRFLIGGDNATIWDLTNGEEIARVELKALWYSQFAVSEQGDWLAFPTEDGKVYLWHLSELLNGTDATAENASTAFVFTEVNPGAAESYPPAFIFMDASPDGTLLAMTTRQGIGIFEIATQTLLHTLPEWDNLVRFSPDGRFLIIGDGTICCGFTDESIHMGRARVWGVPSDK